MAKRVNQVVKVELSDEDRLLIKALIRTLGGNPEPDADFASPGTRRPLVEGDPRANGGFYHHFGTYVVEGEGDWALYNSYKEGEDVE